jgi:hypothetical protein
MLNWLARYAALRDLLLDADGRPRSSILDVGCGPHGLACAFDGVPFVGTDVLFPHHVHPAMVAVRSRPGPLPFADGTFGTVVALDVFEHVPPDDRAAFVLELGRVAAERVIVGCPTTEAQGIDDFLGRQLGEPMPVWLAEHYECGLPTPGELEGCVRALDGFSARLVPTTNGHLAMMIAVADMMAPLSVPAAHEFQRHRREWTDLLAGATFGPSPRKVWLAERTPAAAPRVAPHCPRDEVAAALRCPDCGAGHRELRCTGCGRGVELDATGAWDVATVAPRRAAVETAASTVLWLAPDWTRPGTWVPPLAAYVRHSDPDGDTCLVLDAAGDPSVAGVVSQACADLAGDRPFGEVVLATEPVQRTSGARHVTGEDDVLAALSAAAIR